MGSDFKSIADPFSGGFASKMTGGLFADPDSGDPPISAQNATAQMLQAYLQYLPQLNALSNSQLQDNVNAQLNVNPQINAANLAQFQQYGPAFAAIQQQIANQNAMAGAQTNLDLLRGTGGQAAIESARLNSGLERMVNPEYFSVLQNSARQTNNLLNSINMGGLSPGEQNAVERSLAQSNVGTGNLGVLNPTNTVANAMNFGGAFNSKLGTLGNALAASSNFMNTAKPTNQQNPTAVALGSSQTNQGTNFVNPSVNNAQTNFTQGLLNNISGVMNQQNQLSNTFSNWDSERGKLDSWAGNMAGICCFIFMEAYNGTLPYHVRYWRDYYYEREPLVAVGYKRMAKWLVPKMKSSKLWRALVNWTMVKPITYYGGWKSGLNLLGFLAYPFKLTWFILWRKYGAS